MEMTAIYIIGEHGKKEFLAYVYFSADVRAQLSADFVSYQNTGQPKSGTYRGINGEGDARSPKTVDLRFDLVVAIV